MNNFIKSFILHIKYPYTALIIAVTWVGMAVMIGCLGGKDFELLLGLTGVVTLVIAAIGFRGVS